MTIGLSSKKILYLAMFTFLVGCGGGGSNDSKTNETNVQTPIVSTTNGVRTIDLKTKTPIIISGSCTNEYIYNSKGQEVQGRVLEKGAYKVVFTEYFNKYSNSKGVLYYPSSGIPLEDMPINKLIELQRGDTVLYKLNVLEDSYYMVTQKKAMIYIYNEQLGKIATSWVWDNAPLVISVGDSFELKKGVYYIQGNAHYCGDSGSFKLIKI